MAREELKREATEYADKYGKSNFDLWDTARFAYYQGAEPREKRIAELKKQLDLKEKALSKAKKETKRIADRVNKDKRRLIRRKAELEAQIEKMKCWCNCKNYLSCLEECCRKNISFEKGICYNCKKWELRR